MRCLHWPGINSAISPHPDLILLQTSSHSITATSLVGDLFVNPIIAVVSLFSDLVRTIPHRSPFNSIPTDQKSALFVALPIDASKIKPSPARSLPPSKSQRPQERGFHTAQHLTLSDPSHNQHLYALCQTKSLLRIGSD